MTSKRDLGDESYVGPDAAEPGPRQVVLDKNGQRFVFRYEPGEETRLLTDLADMARDPNCEISWFDAAVLSHQMGQRFSRQLEDILKT
jgi:hypothetical protein